MNYMKLEEARKDKGLTVTEICAKLEINRSTWYRWVGGEHNPSIEKLLKACSIMGIDINELAN